MPCQSGRRVNRALGLFRSWHGGHMLARQRHDLAACGKLHIVGSPLTGAQLLGIRESVHESGNQAGTRRLQ